MRPRYQSREANVIGKTCISAMGRAWHHMKPRWTRPKIHRHSPPRYEDTVGVNGVLPHSESKYSTAIAKAVLVPTATVTFR
jgi:hypothetical protein